MNFNRSKIILLTVVLAVILSACDAISLTTNCESFTLSFYIEEDTILEDTEELEDMLEERPPTLEAFDGNGTPLFIEGEGDLAVSVVIDDTSADFLMTYTFPVAPQANPITVRIYSEANETYPETTWLIATANCDELIVEETGPRPVRTFMDGRINYRDAAAPFAAYGVGDDLHIYWVTGPDTGKLELIVTAEELAAVPEFPETNTLVASNEALGIYVYRLTDGKWQVQARMLNGKMYVLIFDDMFDRQYTSLEVENE